MDTDIFKFFKQHKILLVIEFNIIFWACFMGMLYYPPVYQVSASIEVAQRGTDIENIDHSYDQNIIQVNNIVQKLKSATLLHQALQKLGYDYSIQSREFASIHNRLSVKPLQPSNVIQISLKNPSATESARIVNSLANTLMTENQHSHNAKIDEAISYVTSSLSNIRDQLANRDSLSNQIRTINLRRTQDLLRETEKEINKVNQKLTYLKSSSNPLHRGAFENVLTPRFIEEQSSNLVLLESTLVNDLQTKTWTHSKVKQDQKNIWQEKVRIAGAIKMILGRIMDISLFKNLDDLCAYQVKYFELQLRRTQLQNIANIKDTNNTQLTTLNDLEDRLVKKLVELENVKDPSNIEISWIDKAIPPSEAYFPPGIIKVAGLSLGAAILGCLLVIALLIEIRNLKEKN